VPAGTVAVEQAVPFATLELPPVRLTQVGGFPHAEMRPILHGLAFHLQSALSTHAVHVPVEQYCPLVPHELPSGSFVAVSTHVEVPVEHDVAPTLQALGFVVQATPAAQATQAPALHT